MSAATEQTPKQSRWGLGIWALYGGFVVFILILVVYVSTHNFDLVEPDYYDRELSYQQVIDSKQRAEALPQKLVMAFMPERSALQLTFPTDLATAGISGSVTLYRPSNKRWDRSYELAVSAAGEQIVSLDSLIPGFWRAKVEWRVGEIDYLSEDKFLITR